MVELQIKFFAFEIENMYLYIEKTIPVIKFQFEIQVLLLHFNI